MHQREAFICTLKVPQQMASIYFMLSNKPMQREEENSLTYPRGKGAHSLDLELSQEQVMKILY